MNANMPTIYHHKSLANNYINDYLNLVYNKYIPFQNRLMANLYQLDVENSKYDEDLLSFYRDINNKQHGGRYTLILNFPLYMSTASQITRESSEKGSQFTHNANITAIADPLVNVAVKKGDLIVFQIEADGYYGIYRIAENDSSATFIDPYTKINLALLPGVNVKSLDQFVLDVKAFLPEYHMIFKKEEASMILKLQKLLTNFNVYFNGIYNAKLDAHVENNRSYIDWEYAFKNLLKQYRGHLSGYTFYRSYMEYKAALNPKYNIWNKLTNYNALDPITSFKFFYNNCIKNLDKIRIKTLNDNYKLYQIVCCCSQSNAESNMIELDDKIIDAYNMWDKITNDKNFINNVKEQLVKYLGSFDIENDGMILNLLRFAQVLYILDKVIKPIYKSFRQEDIDMKI